PAPSTGAARRRWPFGARDAGGQFPAAGSADAIFVTRDNHAHTNDIERHYRVALRAARERVVIANAYFFPGYRFIREMRRAARRGVDVRLVLQGRPDMPIVRTAASMLYDHLIRGGVRIYEYCDRPLHGKVALVDGEWSTVGSSNLDPLSLSLNLEANVVIRDRDFNATLHGRLAHLMEHSCRQVEPTPPGRWDGLRLLRSYCLFHLMRWFPAWAGWLPRHEPEISLVQPGTGFSSSATGGDPGHRRPPPEAGAAHPPCLRPRTRPPCPPDRAAAAGRPASHNRWQRLRSQRWWPWAMTLVTGGVRRLRHHAAGAAGAQRGLG
ncbi:cardiolipin synthase ClsB, partial [Paracidovorax cattleyae]|uniref:cardiolipin synthase ClsB n=1 Tax=Paracidovorax cattleyae TaxID=80868 RepID=UPI001E4CA266